MTADMPFRRVMPSQSDKTVPPPIDGPENGDGRGLNRYREYLHLLARIQLGQRFARKFDASDVVQITLLEAYGNREQFRGATEAQRATWLRQILAHNLADLIKQHGRGKRDARRERSLEVALDQSAERLEACFAAVQTSPSGRASRNENLVRLAEKLAELPAAQRQAIEMFHLQGLPLAEVARQLARSQSTVAGLLHRGLKNLRVLLGGPLA
jgi:RNA polymerase sigma-70 factor (ECF subfamily)